MAGKTAFIVLNETRIIGGEVRYTGHSYEVDQATADKLITEGAAEVAEPRADEPSRKKSHS